MKTIYIQHGDDEREIGAVVWGNPCINNLKLDDAVQEILEAADEDPVEVTLSIR